MFNIFDLEVAPFEIVQQMQKLQDWTIGDIARRIRKLGLITPTASYQLDLLQELSMFDVDLRTEVQRILGLTESRITDLYTEAIQSKFIYDKAAFLAHGIPFVPFEKNHFMHRMVDNIITQTQGDMKNITQSMGFATKQAGITVFKPPAQFYQNQMDLATMKVATGVSTLDQAIKQSVREMVNSGLRTVDYSTGHNDRVDVAARRSVFSGLRNLTNNQSEYNASIINSTVFEISWHGGFRPSHAWGGRRFDTTGQLYPKENDLYARFTSPEGKIGTLEDYNCYHIKYSVFPDTPQVFTDHQLDQMNNDEQKIRVFEGKAFDQYQARQQQRAIERAMRMSRSRIAGYEGGGLSAEDIAEAKILYRQQRRLYKEFSVAMELPTEFNRIYTGLVSG